MNATVPQPELTRKFFNLDQANRALPLVKVIVRDIVSLYGEIRDRRDRLADVTEHTPGVHRKDDLYTEEIEEMEASIYHDIERLQEFIAELDQLGVSLKDPQKGLVDFPGLLDGREICLCWMHGEEQVAHWHEIEDGFERRQSVDLLKS